MIAAPLRRDDRGPERLSLGGGSEGLVEVALVGRRDGDDQLAGVRVAILDRFASTPAPPFPADQRLVEAVVTLWRAGRDRFNSFFNSDCRHEDHLSSSSQPCYVTLIRLCNGCWRTLREEFCHELPPSRTHMLADIEAVRHALVSRHECKQSSRLVKSVIL